MSEESNTKSSPFAIITGLAAGGLTAYFGFDYSGPYQWIAEAQLKIMGSYSQKLAFVLTFLVIWAAVALVCLPLRNLLAGRGSGAPPWATPRTPDIGADPTAAGNPAAPVTLSPKKKAGRLADFGLAMLMMGAVLLFMGGRDYLRATSANEKIESATAAQFEAGQPPASTWVRVQGVPLVDGTISYGSGSSPDDYIPIASSDTALPPNGVRLFAKVRPHTTPASGLEGLVTKNDLPGPVRVRMEEIGLLKPGDHWLIDVGKDPKRTKDIGQLLTMIGGGLVLVGLLFNIGRVRQWVRR